MRGVLGLDAAVEVPVVDDGRAQDLRPLDGERAVPGGGAGAAAILGALVDEAHAGAEVAGAVGAHRLDQVEPVIDVEPLDRRRAHDLDGELGLAVGNARDVAHDQPPRALRARRPRRRIAQEAVCLACELSRHAQVGAVAGGGIVAAAAHAFEDRVAVEPLGQEAGEPAVAAEERGAGIAGAGPALVAVRVGDDADAIALLEGVAHDPLEGAPGRVHLHGRFHRVVRELDVGVAPADVGRHHAVAAPKLLEQRVRVMRVGALVDDVGRIGDLGMRGAVHGLALVAVVHVAVAAHGGVGRPLVSRNAYEAARLVELGGQRVELAPEGAGDLEVVALMAHDVEEGLVAAELEILSRGVGAERLVGLAVGVAPEMHERGGARHNAQRIGPAQLLAPVVEHAHDALARLVDPQPLHLQGKASGREARRRRQSADRAVGREAQRAIDDVGWIAPLVVGLDAEPERLARPHQRRQHGAPAHAGPRNDGDPRALGQRDVVVGGDRVGKHAELELALAVGLQADAGRAEAPIAEADGDGVAGR